MSHYFLVSAVIVRVYFYILCIYLVTGCSPEISQTQLQPSIFSQLHTSLATEWRWLVVSYRLAWNSLFQSGGYRYC